MNNWKIRTRISAGFAALIVIAMGLGFFAHRKIGEINTQSAEITDSALPGLYKVAQVQSGLQQNFTTLVTLTVSRDRQEIERANADILAQRAVNTGLLQEYEKTIRTPRGRELFSNLQAARATYSTVSNEVLRLKRESKDDAAAMLLLKEGRPAYACRHFVLRSGNCWRWSGRACRSRVRRVGRLEDGDHRARSSRRTGRHEFAHRELSWFSGGT